MKNNRLLYLIIIVLFIWCIGLTVSIFNKKDANNSYTVINENIINGFSTDFTEVVDDNLSSIVTIEADNVVSSGFIYNQQDDKAYIVTTYHSISEASNINIIFSSSYKIIGKVVAQDIFSDLAIIEVNCPYILKPLKVADSSNLKAGEFLISIGTPINTDYQRSVELAMVSYPLRTIENIVTYNGLGYSYYIDLIQFSAKLTKGYSGSCLLNMNGDLVGMVTMNSLDGYNYALTSNEIKIIVDSYLNSNILTKNRFGFKGLYVSKMMNYEKANLNLSIDSLNGIYITRIRENSIAYLAGVRVGDIVTKINGEEINGFDDYLKAAYSESKTFEFELIRDNGTYFFTGYIND